VGATGFEAVGGLGSGTFHGESVTDTGQSVNPSEANPANFGPRAIENERVRLAGTSPRAVLAAVLVDTISAAMQAGDPRTARVAHEALGRLLEQSDPSSTASSASRAGGPPASICDPHGDRTSNNKEDKK
jgi:hypothetical protein